MQKLTMMMQNNPHMQRVKLWYELLAPKDRRALQILAVALAVFISYLGVWKPVNSWTESQKQDYVHQQEIHDWFVKNKPLAIELQKKQKSGAGQRELSSVVSATARQAGLVLSRVQPDRKGMSLWVDDTPYQKLLKWLVLLENKYEVQVQQIRIDKLQEEGLVKGYIHLAN